jgi:hypothetical protein
LLYQTLPLVGVVRQHFNTDSPQTVVELDDLTATGIVACDRKELLFVKKAMDVCFSNRA